MNRIFHSTAIFLSLLFLSFPAHTIEIRLTAPTVFFETGDAGLDDALNPLFTQLAGGDFAAVIDDLEREANTQLRPFGEQSYLANGFGNANAYSAQSATLQGYQGYKLFAVMGGGLLGIQSPSFDAAEIQVIADTIHRNPDIYAGAAPSVSFNLGLNAGTLFGFFSDDLGTLADHYYFNIKYGKFDYTYPVEAVGDIVMDSTNFGMGIQYQWVPGSKSFFRGLFRWRGINVGSGFFVQSNLVDFSSDMPAISQHFSTPLPEAYGSYAAGSEVSADIIFTPKVNLGIETTTYSVPVEATTSVQLLWLFNMNFGAGFDLVFGRTDITARASSLIDMNDIAIEDQLIESAVTPGLIKLDAGTKNIHPSLMRARLMTGLGLQLGPVKLDIPVYYYFNSGFATGLSGGIVW